jgi:hypothetical protein
MSRHVVLLLACVAALLLALAIRSLGSLDVWEIAL